MKNLKLVMLLIVAFVGSSSLLTAQENDKKVKKKIVIVKKEVSKDGTVTEERIVKEGKEAEEYIKQNDMSIDIEKDEKTQEIRVKVTADDGKKKKKKKGETVEKEIRVRVKADGTDADNIEIIEIEDDGRQIRKEIRKEKRIIIEKDGEETEEIIIKRGGGDHKALFIEKDVDVKVEKDGKIIIKKEEGGKVEVIELDGDDINLDNLKELEGMGSMEMLHLVGDDDRGVLGVQIATEDEGKGIIIKDVYEKSAAKEAGLQKIDIITAVDGQKVVTVKELMKAMKGKQAGDKVKLDYLRKGKAQSATVTLKESGNDNFNFNWNSDDGENIFFSEDNDFVFEGASDRPMLGIMISDSEVEKGVKLSDVIEKSGAEKAGLKKGDILTSIDGKAVNSVKEIFDVLEGKKTGDVVNVTYLRDGKEQRADLKLEEPQMKIRIKNGGDEERIIIIEEEKNK